MIEIGFHHSRHPVGAAADWQDRSAVSGARIATACGSFYRPFARKMSDWILWDTQGPESLLKPAAKLGCEKRIGRMWD